MGNGASTSCANMRDTFCLRSMGEADQFNGVYQKADNRTSQDQELLQLRKENKQLRMKNDILKQAVLIFGQ